MDPATITPEAVAQQLVEKHEKALKVIHEEFEKFSTLEQELEKAAEHYKSDRDTLNEQVQKLKGQRESYYIESRALRKEFITQLQKKKSMSDIPMEVLILTKQIDQLEWEIQTEAVNIDDEKKLVKHIQDNLEKLHNYANMYQVHEEVSKAVKKLTSKMNKKLHMAEKMHSEMMNAVNTSDERHKEFVDAIMKLRDARAKRVGFQHDMDKHTKAQEHWKKIVGTKAPETKKPETKENRQIKKHEPPKDSKQQEKPGQEKKEPNETSKTEKDISKTITSQTVPKDAKNNSTGGASNGQ